MTKLLKKLVFAGAIFLAAFTLTACGGGGGGGGSTGTLELRLTDAAGDYQHVFVTIQEIQVHQAADDVADDDPGWITVMNFATNDVSGKVFDLKELENGNMTTLGVAELEEGDYTQLRLILASDPVGEHLFANYVVIEKEDAEEAQYVIGNDDNVYFDVEELKVPSGLQTGIKIVRGFHIAAQGATALILDFDAKKSVVQAGKSGNWLLKPTIKVLETVNNYVFGTTNPEDANVSAQKYDENADLSGQVKVVNGTTSVDGSYLMYLPPDTYNIVATMEGYVPECQVIDATEFGSHQADPFVLELASSTGTLTGTLTVSVTGMAGAEDSATFSIRQEDATCGVIEIASVNVLNETSSDLIVLEGIAYQVVVSAEGEETYEESVTLADGNGATVVYPPPAP